METITSPKYEWRATYTDGSTEQGTKHAYAAIDHSKLCLFEIIHKETGAVALRIKVEPGQKLIWRSKETGAVALRIKVEPGQKLIWRSGQSYNTKQEYSVIHIIGKQEKIDGVNRQGFALFYETDGTSEFFDRFDPEHPWLKKIMPILESDQN